VTKSNIKDKVNILSQYKNPYSAKTLSKHFDPILYHDLGDIQIEANEPKKMHLTIAFWDISGFSKMCKDLEEFPEALTLFLNKYFNLAIEVIEQYNGVLDKFIGDGILAYFGYQDPKSHGDPYNAINAALELKKKFVPLKEEYIKLCNKQYGSNPDINLKCGINNGNMFLHYFSSLKRDSIVVLGSTINFASRLEGFAEKDEIIISKKLMFMVKDKFELDNIEVKKRLKENSKDFNLKAFEGEKFVYADREKKVSSI
jgi:class 3 adenylate cyclase